MAATPAEEAKLIPDVSARKRRLVLASAKRKALGKLSQPHPSTDIAPSASTSVPAPAPDIGEVVLELDPVAEGSGTVGSNAQAEAARAEGENQHCVCLVS